ncbi:MAG: hypothetical protein WC455_10330 [Dehalococcoidia bacterium]
MKDQSQNNYFHVEDPKECRHPEHSFPSHQSFKNGNYTHRCPSCGAEITVSVSNPTM